MRDRERTIQHDMKTSAEREECAPIDRWGEKPTIVVVGPTGCGKSAVMEIIYRALRDAGLHPFSDQLAHERRMVDEQPRPRETVWELVEAARLFRAQPDDEAARLLRGALTALEECRTTSYPWRDGSRPVKAMESIRTYLSTHKEQR